MTLDEFCATHPDLGRAPDATYRYPDAAGNLFYYRVRIDPRTPGEKKIIRPVTPDGNGSFRLREPKFEGGKPLYNLHDLATADPSIPVWIAEGEKCVDRLTDLGKLGTTSGSSSSARSADWSPLAGRKVVIWRDYDAPGAKYQLDLIRTLVPLGCTIEIVRAEDLGLPDGGDVCDWQGAADELDKLPRRVLTAEELNVEETTVKSEDDAFERAHAEAEKLKYTPYPVEALPEPLRSLTRSAAKSIWCDESLIASPLIAMIASAIGATRRAQIKVGWREPSVIWSMTVGDSGQKKSPGLDIALDILDDLQRFENSKHEKSLADWQAQIGERPRGDKSPLPPKPTVTDIYLTDTTLESVGKRLSQQSSPRGLLILCDELSAWAQSFNQYKGGRGADVPTWLKFYGARSNRTGRVEETRYSAYAAVSISGGIQPEVLRQCFSGINTSNGLLARFLLAYPPTRKRRLTTYETNQRSLDKTRDIFDQLRSLNFGVGSRDMPVPISVPLTHDAYQLFAEWYSETADRLVTAFGAHAAALAKSEGVAARLALVFQLTENPTSTVIGMDAMRSGITIARWHADEAERVYASLAIGDHRTADDRAKLINVIRRHGPVSLREIGRHCRAWQNRDQDLSQTLFALRESKVITETIDRSQGRTTYRYSLVSVDESEENSGNCAYSSTSTPHIEINQQSEETLVL